MRKFPPINIMFYKRWSVFICTLAFFTASAQQISRQAKPAWTAPINFDVAAPSESDEVSSGYDYFMHDYQLDVKSKTRYSHHAYKILSNKGAEDGSLIYLGYDPAFQKLAIHSVRIYRNHVWEDRLNNAKIDVLQREENLENSIYSGDKTVSIILKDIRIGDIVEYDYSITGSNPIFKNKFFFSFYLNGNSHTDYNRCRIISPKDRPLHDYYGNYVKRPVIDSTNYTRTYTWETTDVKALKSDDNAPEWYDPFDLVEVSEYDNWKDVTDWGRDVFRIATPASAALKGELEELKAIGDPEKQTIAALRFVQNNIRYFGIEIGVNSHQPKSPANVLKDGYGDCKDKAYLFCYLLNQLGIQAYPVLVNTDKRISLASCAPAPEQFNHAIAYVKLNGKMHYFDPTIPDEGGDILNYYTPNYAYGLVLKDSVHFLSAIPTHTLSEVKMKEIYHLKSVKGDASLQVKTYYMGYDADDTRYKFSNSAIKEIQDKYREYYESQFEGVKEDGKFAYTDDKDINRIISTENYQIKNIWDKDESQDRLNFALGGNFIRESLQSIDISAETRNAPLRIPYPLSREHSIEVQLPEEWPVTPEIKRISNPAFYYFSSVSYKNNKVTLKYFFKTLRNTVSKWEYAKFREDLNKVFDDLSYTLYRNNKLTVQATSSNVNWLIVLVAVLISALLTILYIYLYRRFSAGAEQDIVPTRLGGWLILPIISLSANILVVGAGLFTNHYFDKSLWLLRTDESGVDYIPGFSAIWIFELFFNLFILFFSAFLINFIVKYSRKVPRLMVAYYIIALVITIADQVMTSYISADENHFAMYRTIALRVVHGAIWIPYFMISERVKETFVR